MSRNIKRFLAVLLACSVATSSITAQATDSANEIRTIIRSNDDENFPLNLQIDIDETTVEYIQLDDPIYEFDEILDCEKLEFDIIASLKDNYNNFSNYDVKLLTLDYSETVYSNSSDNNDSIIISGLSALESYKFEINLANETASKEYVGEFTVIIELDSSLVLDLFYQNSKDLGNIMSRIAPYNEVENNDSEYLADSFQNGVSIYGDFSSKSDDIDYYKQTIPSYVGGGVANLDISLSVADGARVKMRVYNNQGYDTTITSSSGTGIHLRINDATPGTTYYVKLTRYSGSSTDQYYITANYCVNEAWYGQFYSTLASVDYWNPNKLNTLNITHTDEFGTVTTKPAFIQGNSVNNQEDWMEEACGIVAAAMIFRNMGKTMTGYDFRTNYSGEMMADPFTVMLANSLRDGTTMNENSTTMTAGYSPDLFASSYIADDFGVTAKSKRVGTLTCNSEAQLRTLVDTYAYVMVYFGSHWMVVTDYNTTGSTFASRITVCDPAAGSPSTGKNVLLSETTTGYNTKTFSSITSVVVFED